MIAPEHAVVTFNDENKAVKLSISPMRTRKPLKSLGNTPSKQNCLVDKCTGVDKLGKTSTWTSVRSSSSGSESSSVSYDCSSSSSRSSSSSSTEGPNQQVYTGDRITFTAPNKLNVSLDAPSSEESFDQGLQNEHTVFRDLPCLPVEAILTSLSGEENYEEGDFFFIRRANPITEDSICDESQEFIE